MKPFDIKESPREPILERDLFVLDESDQHERDVFDASPCPTLLLFVLVDHRSPERGCDICIHGYRIVERDGAIVTVVVEIALPEYLRILADDVRLIESYLDQCRKWHGMGREGR